MTNERERNRVWLRDWSTLALRRVGRLQTGLTAPRTGAIARRAEPTLRLFGAGRRPGALMATALPHSLPLTLRLQPPIRRQSSPLLTVQSAPPAIPSPPPAADERQESPHLIDAVEAREEVEMETPLQREPLASAVEPAPQRTLLDRILRVLRKPAAAPDDDDGEMEETLAREAEDGAPHEAPPPPVPAAKAPADPARSATPPAQTAESDAAFSLRLAYPAHILPTSSAPSPPSADPALTGSAENQPKEEPAPLLFAGEEAQSGAPARAGRGVAVDRDAGPLTSALLALRRVFKPDPPPADSLPSPTEPSQSQQLQPATEVTPPVAPVDAVATQNAWDSVRPIESRDEAESRTPSPKPGAVSPPSVITRETEKPPSLLHALRRLVRPQPGVEPAPPIARQTEVIQEAPLPDSSSGQPSPRPAEPLRRDAPPPGEPTLRLQLKAEAPLSSRPPTTPDEPLTLARPRVILNTASQPDEEAPATLPEAGQAPVLETPQGMSLPASLPLPVAGQGPPEAAERPRSPRAEPRLVLARQTGQATSAYSIEGPPLPPFDPARVTATRPATSLESATRPSRGLAEAPLSRRSLLTGGGATAARVESLPLVYRAVRVAPLGVTPAGMATLIVPPETVAAIRYDSSASIHRTEDGTSGAGETLPISAGPAAATADLGVAGQEGAEAGSKGEISLEALARKVYDQLRAGLLVERERAGLGSSLIGR
ncbi:MAG: hypothetical protein GEU75_07265 [Dehalococcoidia bacterium]|nr:hypothetical protein [Dehalococcoidia bacterium]